MKGFHERTFNSKHCCKTYSDSPNRTSRSFCSEPGSSDSKLSKTSLWSGLFLSAFSSFETHAPPNLLFPVVCGKKGFGTRSNGWTAAVKRVMNGGSMRRIQERVLGLYKTGISSSTSDIWHLGLCYKISQEDSSSDLAISDGLAAFVEDFSSRILLTYRKGFAAVGDSKYTSDVNWGCMLRSSQMLVAQIGYIIQRIRNPRTISHGNANPVRLNKHDLRYYLFSDSEASTLSIHNLLQAGNGYDLAAGSWVGPYAMCCTWESLVRFKREESELEDQSFPMAIYVVSGNEDGERGGAPIVCIEDASRHCFEFSKGQTNWTPILLLVPLVLGLDKINRKYIPLLSATFMFPHSLVSWVVDLVLQHTLSGCRMKRLSTLIHMKFSRYSAILLFHIDFLRLTMHAVVDIRRGNLEADTSSYHCNVVRHVPLDSVDSSLAIGFYCRDKGCSIIYCYSYPQSTEGRADHYDMLSDTSRNQQDESFDIVHGNNADGGTQEDDCDCQLL
ncbi:hypothetical protein HYC85_000248 [Camellia sinensis]|uniref:Cysteine protease n=1 Tax=Camellia sinensis TaxID=4442 RepID=A0A7J7I287_CAMSI|nr:hypothetical protein HYC85_000248 [Camellia sinensis]